MLLLLRISRFDVEDELSLGILADYCGYAESHLSRRFKRETGENIRDYIRYVRIERAKLLLTSTDESISQNRSRTWQKQGPNAGA